MAEGENGLGFYLCFVNGSGVWALYMAEMEFRGGYCIMAAWVTFWGLG